MTAPAKKPVNGARKGGDYERLLADYFVSLGYIDARRMIRTGTRKHADEGDIDGLPFTVQAKNINREPRPSELTQWLLDARKQAKANDHKVSLLVVKRNGHGAAGASWVHLDLLTLAWLMGGYVHHPRNAAAAWDTYGRFELYNIAQFLVWRFPPG